MTLLEATGLHQAFGTTPALDGAGFGRAQDGVVESPRGRFFGEFHRRLSGRERRANSL
jgi:hypothetical protein